jgi:hypothetical protein
MSKNTTKGKHAELARLIAAVMAHPQTPVTLYNAMADELSDMATYDHHSPEIIEKSLAAFEQFKRARNGGD